MVFIFCLYNDKNSCTSGLVPMLETILANVTLIYGIIAVALGCECKFDFSGDHPGVSQYPVPSFLLYLAIAHLILGVLVLTTTHCHNPNRMMILTQGSTTTGNVTTTTTTYFESRDAGSPLVKREGDTPPCSDVCWRHKWYYFFKFIFAAWDVTLIIMFLTLNSECREQCIPPTPAPWTTAAPTPYPPPPPTPVPTPAPTWLGNFTQMQCTDKDCSVECQTYSFEQYACYGNNGGGSSNAYCDISFDELEMTVYTDDNCQDFSYSDPQTLGHCYKMEGGGSFVTQCGPYGQLRRVGRSPDVPPLSTTHSLGSRKRPKKVSG